MDIDAGRGTTCALVKSLRYSELFNFLKLFHTNSVLLCSSLLAVELIHEAHAFTFFKPRKEKPPKRPRAVTEAVEVSM